MAGCGRSGSRSPKIPPGELVGASEGIGHQLRDGLKAEVPPERWQDRKVVIIGRGHGGVVSREAIEAKRDR